jgi:hypothetical protein
MQQSIEARTQGLMLPPIENEAGRERRVDSPRAFPKTTHYEAIHKVLFS